MTILIGYRSGTLFVDSRTYTIVDENSPTQWRHSCSVGNSYAHLQCDLNCMTQINPDLLGIHVNAGNGLISHLFSYTHAQAQLDIYCYTATRLEQSLPYMHHGKTLPKQDTLNSYTFYPSTNQQEYLSVLSLTNCYFKFKHTQPHNPIKAQFWSSSNMTSKHYHDRPDSYTQSTPTKQTTALTGVASLWL